MTDLDQEIMNLTDQEVRAFAMILASKNETEACKVLDSIFMLTRKGR